MEPLLTRTLEPADGGAAQLTVIAVHGFGSHEEDLLGLAGPLALPLRMVAARAPLAMPGGWGGYAWYQFGPGGRPQPDEFQASLQALITLVHDTSERYKLTSEKLVLLGFSQGAVMSTAAALTIPNHIGGLVAMSGYLPEVDGWTPRQDLVKDLPVLITHGTEDGIVPVQGGRGAAQSLQQWGAKVQFDEFAMGHEVGPAALQKVRAWLQKRMETKV